MQRRRWPTLCLAAASLSLAATGCQAHGAQFAEVAEAASRFVPTFARFESWSRRTARSDLAFQGEQALRDVMFAPLRGDHRVLWAQVTGDHGQDLQYLKPINVDALDFVTVEGRDLGALRVALSDQCPHPRATDQLQRCLVMASAASLSEPGAVRMAFAFDTR